MKIEIKQTALRLIQLRRGMAQFEIIYPRRLEESAILKSIWTQVL